MDNTSVEARVNQVLIEMFDLSADSVRPDAHLYEDLDLDSLDAIDLAVKLKTETGIKLTEQEMKQIRTVGDIVAIVTNHLAANPTATNG